MNVFEASGWCRFDHDPAVAAWVDAVLSPAIAVTRDPQMVADWLRCGGTWFAGVDALPNDAQGRVAGGPALSGAAVTQIKRQFGAFHVDRAQISVIHPGYPKPMQGESEAAFRFRRDWDAAHIDGLLPLGPERRRQVQEPHSYVLGVPLTQTSGGASPMVVWEGSHLIMQNAFREALQGVPPSAWSEVDLTQAYHAARRRCFAECPRAPVHAQPGEAYLIHRLALHGVSKWEDGADAPPEGRMIAYFRPELDNVSAWLA